MQVVHIPVHSFVSLITNSSSEVYICATQKTIETGKALVNLFLKSSGSPHSADDLFTFKLVKLHEDYNEAKKKWEEVEKEVDSESCEYKTYLRIETNPEWNNSPVEKEIAKVLLDFANSMEAIEVCN